jgi:DNA-binding NtrC family response regulator
VEDEAAVRTVCRKALEARGYTILSAGNGEEALAIAASHGTTIHLLLSDVVMPGMSGPELASRLSNQLPGLKVLHISGYSGEAFASQGLLESRALVLQKPFSLDELSTAVRGALDRA